MTLWSKLRSLLGRGGPSRAQVENLRAWVAMDQAKMAGERSAFAAATELAKEHFREFYTPRVAPGAGKPDGSRFCGAAMLLAGESWPACAGCGAALELFLQLNSRDLPPEAQQPFGSGILQLFYCTAGECDSDGGWEPMGKGHVQRVLKPDPTLVLGERPGGAAYPPRQIVGWDADVELPNAEELRLLGITLTDEQERALYESETQQHPSEGEKLLGWPHWVQGVEYVPCPRCAKPMRYVFQIDSEKNIPFMFGDSGIGHISICPDHPDAVAFGWACC